MSRNTIDGFVARFGVTSLRGRFPLERICKSILGLYPDDPADLQLLNRGLVRLSDVAARSGIGAETLMADIRTGKLTFPPLYVFGPRQHVFVKAQIDAMFADMRSQFPSFSPVDGHAVTRSDLASRLDVDPADIAAVLDDAAHAPAHIIERGVTRFIVADVAHRIPDLSPDIPPAPEALAVKAPGAAPAGMLSRLAAGAATNSEPAGKERTLSARAAPGGDPAHGTPAEAKLSGT
jgi:predicted DNA-binding transcriptional regulator AlpA